MSGQVNGLEIDLEASVDREFTGDVGVPASAELLAFTNAVQLGDGDINSAREALADVVGDTAARDAAATIAIFNGLVRVADGTGIELDEGVFAVSADVRESLGLNGFAGAANSAHLEAGDLHPSAVSELFGGRSVRG